ncbi:MAG: helix-hairpin-helix domain-containing protein [bacterium]
MAFSLLLSSFALLYHYLTANSSLDKLEKKRAGWLSFLQKKSESTPSALISLPESLPGASQLALGKKIDLNRATLEDLMALPAVGEKMASQIIQDRAEKGPFRRVEDLMRVKGIKEKKFAILKPYVTVGKP